MDLALEKDMLKLHGFLDDVVEEINDSKMDPPLDFQLHRKITFHIQNYSGVSCYLQCLQLLNAMGCGSDLQDVKE